MTNQTRGGRRVGAGRPKTDRTEALCVRVSRDAMRILNAHECGKSELVDYLITKFAPYVHQHNIDNDD